MLQVLQGGEYVSVNNPNGTSWQVPPVECADRRCPKSAPSLIRERHRRVSGQMLLRVEVVYYYQESQPPQQQQQYLKLNKFNLKTETSVFVFFFVV